MNASRLLRLALLHTGLLLLWLPAAAFWHFAAWQFRLQTALDNERARHDRR